MITWGIIVCCIAAVQNYGGLIACRVRKYFILSPDRLFIEFNSPRSCRKRVLSRLSSSFTSIYLASPQNPQCLIYYLAFWFPPSELALRIAAVTACGHFSGFVGGWLAFATSFADSLGGLAGWRWLFIIGEPSCHDLVSYLSHLQRESLQSSSAFPRSTSSLTSLKLLRSSPRTRESLSSHA